MIFLTDFFSSLQPMKTVGDTARNLLHGPLLLFEHFQKFYRYSVSIAHKLSHTIWTFSKGSSRPVWRWPKGLQQHVGALPSASPYKQLFSFRLPRSTVFTFLFIQNQRRN
jgi:hypothetical protein